MHKLINKIIWLLVLILMVLFILFMIFNKREKEYTKKLFYMDTYIYIKINTDKDGNKILKEVENIYKEYHELSDRYNGYNNIKNIYYIKNNKEKSKYIKIDKKLYNLIKYGLEQKEKTNNLIDIGMGNVIDIWKNYRDNGTGLPSMEELKIAKLNQKEIVLKDGKILNNHPNIDLGCISKGYTTKIVGEYLKKKGINKYLINAGGNVLVGDNINNKEYTIGIENPDQKDDIFTVIKGKNISVVTSGGYERFYEYDGKKYSHIIDPNSLYPTDYMKSVTIINKDSALADILSTFVFLMDVEEGKEYIDKLDNTEAIWYTNDNKIIYSKNAKKYVYKNK